MAFALLISVVIPFVPVQATISSVDSIGTKTSGDYVSSGEVNSIINTLKGFFYDDNGTPDNGDDRIGVLNGAPQKTLDVEGDINFSGDLYKNNVLLELGKWTKNAWGIYYGLNLDGSNIENVGIGAEAPRGKLHISVKASNPRVPLLISREGATVSGSAINNDFEVAIASGNKLWGIDADDSFNIGTTSKPNLLVIDPEGRVSASNPVNADHLATKAYVDQQVLASGGSTVSVSASGISDGSGQYFYNGGDNHFCQSLRVDSFGETTIRNINSFEKCASNTICAQDGSCSLVGYDTAREYLESLFSSKGWVKDGEFYRFTDTDGTRVGLSMGLVSSGVITFMVGRQHLVGGDGSFISDNLSNEGGRHICNLLGFGYRDGTDPVMSVAEWNGSSWSELRGSLSVGWTPGNPSTNPVYTGGVCTF